MDRCTSAPASASACTWRSRPCGSPAVPTTVTTTGCGTRLERRGEPAPPGRARRRGRGRRRAAARRSRGPRPPGPGAPAAASGRSSGAPGRWVYGVVAEVHERVARIRCRRSAAPPGTACRRRTARGSAARWSSRRAALTRRPATRAPRGRAGSAPARSAAVRSGRPGPSSASSTGVSSASAYAVISSPTAPVGGLDTSTISSTAGSASSRRSASRVASPPISADRSRPPTPSAELTPTPAWSSSASTCWQPVPDAATMPTGPGETTFAKPSPRPSTTAVPQSGPITSTPRSAAARLSASSCSTGTLSLKIITSRPASTASIASTKRVLTRHRDQRDRRRARRAGRSRWSGAARPRRAGRSSGRLRTSACVHPGEGGLERRPASSSRSATTRWFGVASAGTSKPISAEHLDVERGGHRDLGRGHPGQALDGAADLEQGHRVGVGARAQLDVPVSRRHAASAIRAPSSSPAPEVCPIARQLGRAVLLVVGVPSAAEVRRELGEHLAVHRAVEQRRRQAAWCGAAAVADLPRRRPAWRRRPPGHAPASRTARRRRTASGRRRRRPAARRRRRARRGGRGRPEAPGRHRPGRRAAGRRRGGRTPSSTRARPGRRAARPAGSAARTAPARAPAATTPRQRAVQVEVERVRPAVQDRPGSVGRPAQPVHDPSGRTDRNHLADAIRTTYASPM